MAGTRSLSPKSKPFSRKALLEILRDQYGEGDYGEQKLSGKRDFSVELKEERQKSEVLRQRLFEVKQQERVIFSAQEKRVGLQIQAVREELTKLAQSVSVIDKEIETAINLQPVEPGVYYLSFFEKLKNILKEMAERIDESATWLATFNKRARKQNFYWGQVKKSGTKFMLSQERYMATQVG